MEPTDSRQTPSGLQLRISDQRFLLIAGDLFVAVISLGISLFVWAGSMQFIGFSREFLQERIPVWFYFLPLVWLVLLIELYDVHRAGNWGQTVRSILIAGLIGLAFYLILYFLFADPPRNLLPRLGVGVFLVSVVILTLLWRLIYIRIK